MLCMALPPTKFLPTPMVIVLGFWDAKRILIIDYLENDDRLISEYSVCLLYKVSENFISNRPSLANKNILFYQHTDCLLYTSRCV